MHNKQCGGNGEDIACKFLENKGYNIIERNYKFGRAGEIDIIALDGSCMVFVEVKTRTNHNFGSPLEAISMRKRKLWQLASNGYMIQNGLNNQECRLDLIAVDLFGSEPQITHIENAVY